MSEIDRADAPTFSHHKAIYAAYCELSQAVCAFLCDYHGGDNPVALRRLHDWKGPDETWPAGLKDILHDADRFDAAMADEEDALREPR
jgi:hypothetical protein